MIPSRRAELLQQDGYPAAHFVDDGFSVPEAIWSRLFPYQQEGVAWLWKMHKRGEGCILAVHFVERRKETWQTFSLIFWSLSNRVTNLTS